MSVLASRLGSKSCACGSWRSQSRSWRQGQQWFGSWSDLSRLLPGGGQEESRVLEGCSRDKIRVHREEKVMPFSQRQLFRVVADVEHYPDFVPFCTSASIIKKDFDESLSRRANSTSSERFSFDASVSAGFMGFSQNLISRVECKPFDYVNARASHGSGLFQHLVTNWAFRPIESPNDTSSVIDIDHPATRVQVQLEFAFGHGREMNLGEETWGALTRKMISAFEKRAIELYQ